MPIVKPDELTDKPDTDKRYLDMAEAALIKLEVAKATEILKRAESACNVDDYPGILDKCKNAEEREYANNRCLRYIKLCELAIKLQAAILNEQVGRPDPNLNSLIENLFKFYL